MREASRPEQFEQLLVRQTSYAVILAVGGGAIRIEKCGSVLSEVIRDNFGVEVAPPTTGDLVIVEAAAYRPDLSPNDSYNYFVITDRLRPELSVETGTFRTELENIAQTHSTLRGRP